MKLKRGSVRALSIAFLFVAAGGFAAGPPPASPIAERMPLVVLELTQSGDELPPAQRDAMEKAVLSTAKAADVVLCRDGHPSLQAPDLEALCSQPDRDLPRLWWRGRAVKTRLRNRDFLRLSLELEAGPKAPSGLAQLMIVATTPLPSARKKAADLLVAEEITASLAALPELQTWFGALRQRPELARTWPSEKAASVSPPPAPENPTPPKAEKAPEPRKKIEIKGDEGAPAKTSAASDVFLVREALVGGGFSQGVTGSLRVSPAGLGFTPKGKSREQWSLSWSEVQEVSNDAGTWDVSHPLVIVDQKGRKRYIARIDSQGNYLPGEAILAAVRQKRSA
jgi:hypothetical protein